MCYTQRMLITGYHNEAWDLMGRGTDKDSGLPMCHVRRTVLGTKRTTVWRLVQRPKGWYNVGQIVSTGNGFRPSPERLGKKLSNSRIDLTLLSFAQEGHPNAYA